MNRTKPETNLPHVVIIGGGFGGLYAAKALGNQPVRVTLVDRQNYHLFQPLLYQVATGALSIGDIAAPLRDVLKHYHNEEVLLGEVTAIEPKARQIRMGDDTLDYDMLVVATGGSHFYFGHDDWARYAPGLKTAQDAVNIRNQIFMAYEAAERERDPQQRQVHMTFVIVGGGPTGVELAGAVAELAHHTLEKDFQHIDPADTRIYLIEGNRRILPSYSEVLSEHARKKLEALGVTVLTQAVVTDLRDHHVELKRDDLANDGIDAGTILWAAGVKASPLGRQISEKTGALLDKSGRILVEPDLSIKDFPELFVIGDLANFAHQDGTPLPGVASVAMQEGMYVAEVIKRRVRGKPPLGPFQYHDKGSLAVIGRNAAVADLHSMKLHGFIAWFLWLFVHIQYLVGFENKVLVLFQWAWSYFTRGRSARLITTVENYPSTFGKPHPI